MGEKAGTGLANPPKNTKALIEIFCRMTISQRYDCHLNAETTFRF